MSFGYTFNFKKFLLAESALTVPLILIIVSYWMLLVMNIFIAFEAEVCSFPAPKQSHEGLEFRAVLCHIIELLDTINQLFDNYFLIRLESFVTIIHFKFIKLSYNPCALMSLSSSFMNKTYPHLRVLHFKILTNSTSSLKVGAGHLLSWRKFAAPPSPGFCLDSFVCPNFQIPWAGSSRCSKTLNVGRSEQIRVGGLWTNTPVEIQTKATQT